MTIDYRSEELKAESMKKVEILQSSWMGRVGEAEAESDDAKAETKDTSVEAVCSSSTNWKNPFLTEFLILLRRNWIDMVRDKPTIFASIGQAVVNVLLLGFIFFRLDLGETASQNRVGALFMMTIQNTFGTVMPTISVFTLQRMIIKRERAAGTYRASSAYFSKIASQLPLTLAGCLLFALPVYWMIGLQNSLSRYLTFIAILLIHACIAVFMGIMISSGVPNVQVGTIIGPIFIVIFLIFGGPLVNLDTAPDALKWIKWLSVIRYTFSALSINEFTGLVFSCPPNAPACAPNGETTLKLFSLDALDLWYNVLVNFCLGLAFIVIGFLLFNWKSKPLLRLK